MEGPVNLRQAADRHKRPSLFSAPYLLVLAANFFSYANYWTLDPVLPLYLASVGQTPAFLGVTIAAFSVTSFVTRPFVGQGVDRWSAVGVYVLGGLALGMSSLGYLLPSIAVLLLARTVHGLGWAAINTAGAAVVSQATPVSRLGEAVGYFGMMRSFAQGLMPGLGFLLLATAGFPSVFVASAVWGLAAAVAVLRIHEKPRERDTAPTRGFWQGLIEPGVALPSLLNALLNSTHPMAFIFVVLYARDQGIDDLSLFFLANGATMVVIQAFGHLSDRWGRAPIMAVGFALSALGLAMIMWSTSLPPLVIGGIVYSAGSTLVMPAMMALALDRTPAAHRGAGMATYTAAFQIGTGVGGLAWGFVIEWWGYREMFLAGIALLLAPLAVIGANWQSSGGGRGGRDPTVGVVVR